MKKIFCFLLTLVTLFALSVPALAAQPDTMMPYYVNASSAKATLAIDNDGEATIGVTCVGNAGTTSISVTYYLEHKVGSSWVRVDIGTSNDQWTYSTTSRYLSQSKVVQVNDPGDYRVTAILKVTISSTETITVTDEFTW